MSHKYLTPEQLKARLARPKKPSVAPSTAPTQTWGSLKKYCPVPYDQGQLGSCTSNSFCAAYKTMCNYLKNPDAGWDPSRLWVYYWERVVENPNVNPSTLGDTGADVTDAETYVQKNGVCSEALFPYVPANFDNTPTAAAVADAAKHKIKSSASIPIDANLIGSIESAIQAGSPVLTAISVYQSFEGSEPAETGMVPMPDPATYNDPNDPNDPYLGGHEVCIVGYTRSKQLFTVLNSWGAGWGAGGFFYLPYAYVSDNRLGLEFTTIQV